jgi:hypothetical protein
VVDERARQAALEGSILDRPLSSCDFQSLARPALMRAWQAKRDSADTGRFTHSYLPDVTLRPYFEGKTEGKGLFGLCQRFYLDIVLFDRIVVDFELSKI